MTGKRLDYRYTVPKLITIVLSRMKQIRSAGFPESMKKLSTALSQDERIPTMPVLEDTRPRRVKSGFCR